MPYTKEKNTRFYGLYYNDDKTFFAIYPTKMGPIIFYNRKEYTISKDLAISLTRQENKGRFTIVDYGIEINYTESPYIGFDAWSEEIDIDLFYIIEQCYQEDEFYEQYTIADS